MAWARVAYAYYGDGYPNGCSCCSASGPGAGSSSAAHNWCAAGSTRSSRQYDKAVQSDGACTSPPSPLPPLPRRERGIEHEIALQDFASGAIVSGL